MSNLTATYEIGLDTPIHLLTPRQLFSLQAEWANAQPDSADKAPANDKRYAYSMRELAEQLHISTATAFRMKASGAIDEAISQCGKWICIDVDKVIELTRLSNRKKKRK